MAKQLSGRSAPVVQHHTPEFIARARESALLRIAFVWFVLAAVFGLSTETFLSVDNFLNIARASSVFGIAALGVTLALISGSLDVSFAAIMSLSGVLAAERLAAGNGLIVALAGAFTVGAILGGANGLLVVVLKVDALIVTLGTLSIFGGYTFLRTSGSPVVADNEVFAHVGRGAAFGVPIVVVTLFAVALILGGVLRYTTFGQRCYAVGDNGRAAQLAGVRVAVIRVSALAISGATASIAGLLVVANSGVASPGTGDRYLLSAIAAVVIGGTPLAGGIGTISGTLVGIAVLGTIDNGLNLLEVSSFWQDSLRGTIVLFALIADGLRRRPK